MSKGKNSVIGIALGVLLAGLLKRTAHGARRLAWRWRRVLTPLWVGLGVWLLAVLVRWHWSAWWWVVLVLPVAGTTLAVLGPRLGDRVRTAVMVLVPEGLDRGKDGVLDRPAERVFLGGFLGYLGLYLAVRIGDGASDLTEWLWQIGVLGFGGVWWWHRRIRVAGRADKFARKWGKITRGESSLELRVLAGSKVLRAAAVGRIAKLRVRLAEGATASNATRAADGLASYFHLRPGAVFISNDADRADCILVTILPKDPWKGRLAHPLPAPGSLTLIGMRFRFPMGITAEGRELVYQLAHTLVVGRSGAGKSVWLESLLLWLLAFRDIVLVGIDLAGGATLGMFRKCLALPLADDPDSARWTLERVLAVIEDRERTLARTKETGDSEDDEFQPNPAMPWLVLVIDEYPDLIAAGGKEVITLLNRIAKRARKCGVRLEFLTQNGSKDDVGSKEIQAQLKAIVGMALDDHASKVLWGTATRSGWTSTGLSTGQFLLRDEEHTQPEVAKGWFATPRERRAIITAAAQDRPVLEPSAWAALTDTAGMVVDLPEEDYEVEDEILTLLRDGGRTVAQLVELPGMPSRATIFRRLNRHATDGKCHSEAGVWYLGTDKAARTA